MLISEVILLLSVCTQIQVVWMSPAGPAISDSCNIFDALAPPPLPIQYINITEVNTQRVLPSIIQNSVDVIFFIRLVCHLCISLVST